LHLDVRKETPHHQSSFIVYERNIEKKRKEHTITKNIKYSMKEKYRREHTIT
jgi:hypothetical protein